MAGRPLSDPLTAYREGLALFRRAGLDWEAAQEPAREAALHVAPSEHERKEWSTALHGTLGAWRSAYEGTPGVGLKV
jgi:hypothetical protein